MLLVLLQTVGTLLYAQDTDHRHCNVDSLENVLRSDRPSSEELLAIYHDLSRCCLYADDYEKLMLYSRKGIALAEDMDSLYIVADLYNNLGMAYDYASKPDSAMLYFDKAFEAVARMEAESIENPDRTDRVKAFIYSSKANLYSSVQDKTDEGLAYYFEALKLFEKYKVNDRIAKVLGNIGIAYYNMENYEQAKIYLLKKASICRENGYEVELAHALNVLGAIYLYEKNFTESLSTAEEARAIFERQDTSPIFLLDCYSSLSYIYLVGYGNDDKAMEYVGLALKKAKELNTPLDICQSLLLQSEILLFRKNYAAAEKSALEALQTDSTHFSVNQGLYECLTRAHIGLGNVDKAFAYFDRFKQLQMNYANENFQKQLSDMEVKYETEKKETRIAVLEGEKRLMIWLSVAGGTVLLLALTAFFLLWRWTVQRKRLVEQQIKQLEQEKQLVATQSVLDGEIQERTRLARDLHDGLGSMLTGTKMNIEDLKKDVLCGDIEMERIDHVLTMLNDSSHELRRIAHHLMPDSLSRFGLKVSIGDFCNTLPNVIFSWYGDEGRLEAKLETRIYRMIHELVNNALKHAGASHILVQVIQDAARIAFTVQDDGCGFDVSAVSQGMGLQNIRTRVASFGGIMNMASTDGEGTEVNVELRMGS